MKFDQLVEQLLNEVSQPFTGYDSYTSRGMQRVPSDRGYDRESDERSRERNVGVERVGAHYELKCNDVCVNWYKKNLPDSTVAKYGWKTFHSPTKAKEFAKKWGIEIKEVGPNPAEFNPKYVAG